VNDHRRLLTGAPVESTKVREVLGFLVSGAIAFVVQFALFNLLVGASGAVAANGIALVAATLVAYVANRAVSFAHRRSQRRWRELAIFVIVNAMAVALSELVILAGVSIGVAHGRLALNALTLVAAAIGLVVRFVAYRHIVFTGSAAA
jgi:putative flippase GtrA